MQHVKDNSAHSTAIIEVFKQNTRELGQRGASMPSLTSFVDRLQQMAEASSPGPSLKQSTKPAAANSKDLPQTLPSSLVPVPTSSINTQQRRRKTQSQHASPMQPASRSSSPVTSLVSVRSPSPPDQRRSPRRDPEVERELFSLYNALDREVRIATADGSDTLLSLHRLTNTAAKAATSMAATGYLHEILTSAFASTDRYLVALAAAYEGEKAAAAEGASHRAASDAVITALKRKLAVLEVQLEGVDSTEELKARLASIEAETRTLKAQASAFAYVRREFEVSVKSIEEALLFARAERELEVRRLRDEIALLQSQSTQKVQAEAKQRIALQDTVDGSDLAIQDLTAKNEELERVCRDLRARNATLEALIAR